MDQTNEDIPLIAIAGASGFVGTHLRQQLSGVARFQALTRRPIENSPEDPSTNWHLCDLYSIPQLTEAMQGCTVAFYLVHSMAPTSRLNQANFEDTDLLLADNFARAAEAAGVKHLVYLGGLIPENASKLSAHLRSRREVEAVLRSRSVTVTVLRAGIIFGLGGSSFSILVNLVRRLRFMILPAWARSTTHSIDVKNVCDAFELCLDTPELAGGCYDLGGHAPMTYRELIFLTAKVLDKRIHALDFPVNCFAFSKLWVSLFGGVPRALVGPLQESLRHSLKARDNPLLTKLRPKLIPFETSLRQSIDASGRPNALSKPKPSLSDTNRIREERRVLSVQRLPLPARMNAQEIAVEYGLWLTQRFKGLIRVQSGNEDLIRFTLLNKWSLLELTPTPYATERERRSAFYITGGALSRKVQPYGRLEFRIFPDNQCILASIFGYAPTLPWILYRRTQALLHLLVMHSFRRHLGKLALDPLAVRIAEAAARR